MTLLSKWKYKAGTLALITAITLTGSVASAQQIYKFGSFAPGLAPFTVNTAFAQMAKKYANLDLQIIATGPGVRHQLLTVQNKMDFFMLAPITYWLMYYQRGPYKKIKNGKELLKNHCGILTYELGPYHFVTYAESGIKTLEDLAGKKVFIGPPGSSAARTVAQIIKQHSGVDSKKDFEPAKISWGAAAQAFQDRKIDVLIIPSNYPNAAIQQIALTNKIRLLTLDPEKMKTMKISASVGRTQNAIPADAYGANQVNDAPSYTYGATVGIGTRCSMPDDVVYKVTKAFWDNINETYSMAPWMSQVLTLEKSLQSIPKPIHPGAKKYYDEIGAKTSLYEIKE